MMKLVRKCVGDDENSRNPANKMLADCRQTGSRFDQKMSAS